MAKANCALLIVMERYGKNGNISFSLMDQPFPRKEPLRQPGPMIIII